MKYLKPNPKSEDRSPKEGRNPKADSECCTQATPSKCDSWSCGMECGESAVVLREEDGGNRQPQELDERTAVFGEDIIEFAKKIPKTAVNDRLISQLVGAGTSVGANYCEADDAVSGKDFKLKIGICRKESKETMFFLRMLARSEPSLAGDARKLWREAKELNLIFGSIWRK